MNEIGGYFGLELQMLSEYHQNALSLNTGRNAFEYILLSKEYNKIFLPYYTCKVMLQPIIKHSLDYEFYHINDSFFPIFDFSKIKSNEAFVYTNYFGICDSLVEKVSKNCENLIVDNSQAFYCKPLKNVDTFYSARKFFGVPDGSYLYTNKRLSKRLDQDNSYMRFEHLLGRIDLGPENFYSVFKKNDEQLDCQNIKRMSKITQRILSSLNYDDIKVKRLNNFNFLHNELREENLLKIKLDDFSVPMVYPLLVKNGKKIKEKLIKNKIFIPTYWPNVKKICSKDSLEYFLSDNLLALPVDQRYDGCHMRCMSKKVF